jgi:hypothetical protein
MRLRVVCGFGVTMATFSPVSLFASVDFLRSAGRQSLSLLSLL